MDDRASLQSWHKPLYNLAYRALGHREDAADATQDIFLAIVRNMPALSGDKRRAWIFRVAHNIVCSHIRRRRRQRLKAVGSVEPESEGRHEDEAERHEDVVRLMRGLQELPEDRRLPLLLAYFQGLTQEEIGAALDLPRTTVQSRLKKGLEQLRGLLGAGAPAALPDVLGALPRLDVPPILEAKLAMTTAAPITGAALMTGGLVSKTKITLAALALAALSFGAGLSLSARAENPKAAPAPSPELAALREQKAALEKRLEGLVLPTPAQPSAEAETRAALSAAREDLEASRERNKDLQSKLARLVAERSERSAAAVLGKLFALYREHGLARDINEGTVEDAMARGRVISQKLLPLIMQLGGQEREAIELTLAVIQDRSSPDRDSGLAIMLMVKGLNKLEDEASLQLHRGLLAVGEDPSDEPDMRAKALALMNDLSPELRPRVQSLALALRDHEDPGLRKEAWKLMAQLPEDWARREVEDYLFNAAQPVEARKEALLALSFDGHPRALEILGRALAQEDEIRNMALAKSLSMPARAEIGGMLIDLIAAGAKAEEVFFLPGAIALHGDESAASRLEAMSRDQALSEAQRALATKSLETLRDSLAKKAKAAQSGG